MAASSKASVAGLPAKKRKVGTVEASMVSSLAEGFAALESKDHQSDLEYLEQQLGEGGPDADLLTKVCSLLRNGTLRKALTQKDEDGGSADLGKPLSPTTDALRGLREQFLQQLLRKFEPEVFNDAGLEAIKDEKNKTLLVGM
eukprot:3604428-Amphidinium_carterae.1